MHLDDGDADGADAVGQGDGGMGIASGVHHHGIILSISLLQFVDKHAFVVGLEIANLVFGEAFTELRDEFVKRETAIDFGLAFADEVEVGTVEDEDFHLEIFLQK